MRQSDKLNIVCINTALMQTRSITNCSTTNKRSIDSITRSIYLTLSCTIASTLPTGSVLIKNYKMILTKIKHYLLLIITFSQFPLINLKIMHAIMQHRKNYRVPIRIKRTILKKELKTEIDHEIYKTFFNPSNRFT